MTTTTTTTTNQKQNNHLLYSLDHPLNICLRRLCQTNENTTVADHSFHKQHALKLINKDSNIYAMYDYSPTYPFLLAVQTGDKVIVEAILKQAKSYIELNIIEPLICACTKSFYDIVQVLIDFGFNPNTIMINRDYTKLINRKLFSILIQCNELRPLFFYSSCFKYNKFVRFFKISQSLLYISFTIINSHLFFFISNRQ